MFYREVGGVYVVTDKKGFSRNKYINSNKKTIKKYRDYYNNTDVFITPYYYNNPLDVEKSLLYSYFYMDLDIDLIDNEHYNIIKDEAIKILNFFNKELEIPFDLIKIYFSGNKGFHFFIHPIVFGLTPDKDTNVSFKLFAKRLINKLHLTTVDTVIYDKKRLLRMANSINSKTNLYKVRITYEQLKTFSYINLIEYAKSIKEDKNIPINKLRTIEKAKSIYQDYVIKQYRADGLELQKINNTEKKELLKACLPCVLNLIETGVPIGSRNNATVAIASSLFQTGAKLEQVIDFLIEWNYEKNNETNSKEIINTVKSAYQFYQSNKVYGCQTFKDLDACMGCICKLYIKGK